MSVRRAGPSNLMSPSHLGIPIHVFPQLRLRHTDRLVGRHSHGDRTGLSCGAGSSSARLQGRKNELLSQKIIVVKADAAVGARGTGEESS